MRDNPSETPNLRTLVTTSYLYTPSAIPAKLPERLNGTVIPMGFANLTPSGPKLTASPPASWPPAVIGSVAGISKTEAVSGPAEAGHAPAGTEITSPLKPRPDTVNAESALGGGEKAACDRTTTRPRLSSPGRASFVVVSSNAVLVVAVTACPSVLAGLYDSAAVAEGRAKDAFGVLVKLTESGLQYALQAAEQSQLQLLLAGSKACEKDD